MRLVALRGRPHRRRRPASRRAGFTLVELIVAIIILVIGVLGLASASAVVMRQIAGSSAQSRAAAIAQSRFEQIRSQSCAAAVGGTRTDGGITETWRTTMLNRSLQIVVVVSWREKSSTRTQTFTTIRPCV